MSPRSAGAQGRTIYESSSRRRARRRRIVAAAVALLVLGVAAAGVSLVVGRGAGARGGPQVAVASAPRSAVTSTAQSAIADASRSATAGSSGSSAAAAPLSSGASSDHGAASGPSASASPGPSPSSAAVRTVALGAAEVHRGQTVALRYRIDDPAGLSWAAKLVVLDAGGGQVRAQRLGDAVTSGVPHTVSFRVALAPGRYSYLVHVDDGAGGGETAARSARLTVLPPLPPAFPGAKAVTAALAWAAGRSGKVAVAVVDSHGRLTGIDQHATFQGASLVKAMLLVAYLRSHSRADAALDPVATRMVEESDNASAYTIQGVVGVRGLEKVAKLTGMRDFRAGSGWLDSRVSAADQARFFYDYVSYVPAARRAFARRLLSGITHMQRWGIPAAAGPEGWKTFFKGGWLGLDNRLMVQAAWLEKGGAKWALAVLTDDDPGRSYGWDTEKGVTGLLLGRQPTAAYLARVLE